MAGDRLWQTADGGWQISRLVEGSTRDTLTRDQAGQRLPAFANLRRRRRLGTLGIQPDS
jgi:hypothetical protein